MRGILIRVGIVAAIVVVGLILRPYLSGNAGDLNVGDCFDLPTTTTDTVDDVQHRPCGDDHQAEVFFVGDYPGSGSDPFPTDNEMSAFISEKCLPTFNTYTGRDYDTWEEMDFSAFSPTSEGWSDGDQEVTCFLLRVDLEKFKGSLKAA